MAEVWAVDSRTAAHRATRDDFFRCCRLRGCQAGGHRAGVRTAATS